MLEQIESWLERFDLDPFLRGHVAEVLASIPEHVRSELMNDPRFSMCDYEPGPRATITVPLSFPTGSDGQSPSRAVVFKRTLRGAGPLFVKWVIAHELAHAHLRNDGRWPGDDPETAADALAAEWGFPKSPYR